MANYERHDEHHTGLTLEQQILVELRELRTDFNREARASAERFSRLETLTESVVGGTQPGRLTLLEDKVAELSAWRWKMVGICAGVASTISVVTIVLEHIWK